MVAEKELAGNLKSFLEYNRLRIYRAMQASPNSSKLALYVIPLLLEYNHRELPGYVESSKEYSVSPFFEITDEHRAAAESFIKNFKAIDAEINNGNDYNLYAEAPKTLIHSLLLMGSVGTVAQNEKSDFDYWVVYDETKLEKEEFNYLKKKLALLEKWGEKMGAELHFFLTEVARARENNWGGVDEESAGSTQALLLKEEFYRTVLLVSGRYPVWFVTPPSVTDKEYAEIMEMIAHSFELDPSKFVNLGNINSVPKKEIFGAALWQINKAMDSPFKSVLKMGMLESFLSPKGKSLLLCDELKQKVFESKSEETSPDPYLILIDRLIGYYENRKRTDIVELLTKCVYNKVHIKISEVTLRKSKKSFKERMMLVYTNKWGWSTKDIGDMNDYDEWAFDRMLKLGSQLHNFLIETYKNLTSALKKQQQDESIISKEDLTVLGNKLFAFYNRKETKVEFVRRATDYALKQESVTFNPIIVRGKKPVWVAYRGNVTTQIARKEATTHAEIKRSTVLSELVIWLLINKIIDQKSFLHLVSSPLPASLLEIQNLIKVIDGFMPPRPISSIPSYNFQQPAKTAKLLLIGNFASQQWAKQVEELTILHSNTHGEMFMETHAGQLGIQRAVKIYAAALSKGIENPHQFFKIYMPRAENSARLEKQLMNTILSSIKQMATRK